MGKNIKNLRSNAEDCEALFNALAPGANITEVKVNKEGVTLWGTLPKRKGLSFAAVKYTGEVSVNYPLSPAPVTEALRTLGYLQ